ncbi:MAG: heme ABC exporter ATP-binding protein CcmA [Wolbachia endosymbiont of Menacanthus eurysternus]|nr:MAG: heme ABC exporter ATP-binding protein CcmA [Wolbachia endosymbiont of Menacanthus eurysternus]
MIECKNLSCARNNKVLFKNLNFHAKPKSKILITGPNGSGKTTLIKSLSVLLPPITGNIKYCGKDIYDNPKHYIQSMIYIGHKNAYKNRLTVAENIEFWAEIRNTKELIMASVYCLQLQPVLNIRYNELSAGWKRRAALARLLISNANIWLIDEPFCNLDDATRKLVLNLISIRYKQNGIIIITEHNPYAKELYDFTVIDLTLFNN